MIRRAKRVFLPLIATLMVIVGLTAGVTASTGIQLPSWGSDTPGDFRAGPLGLNPTADGGAAPVSIQIPDAGVDAEVERNQIVDGVMLDPSGPWVVSWYQETAQLGQMDNVVMSGHVDYWDVGPAVFWEVPNLPQGAQIKVAGEDGSTYTYEVEWVQDYEVSGLTPESINEIVGPTDYRSLTLITCGGEFNYDAGEYLSRTVIRARLVDTQAASGGAEQPAEGEQAAAEGGNEPASGELAVGGTATVTDNGLNMRSEPSTGASIVTTLAQGQQVTITGGPEEGDGFTWWQIELDNGNQGWVAEDFLSP